MQKIVFFLRDTV